MTDTAGQMVTARLTWRTRLRWKLFPRPEHTIGDPREQRTFVTVQLYTTLSWADR